ncbi:hypothetical protein, partial [Chitinophaga sp.]|uniref:hypothetical protein n=1 Tax=Chitinophaga sp. TaxID=1869181 RepID=UPI002FDE3423
ASVKKTTGRKILRWQNRDCLEMQYDNADDSHTIARFFIQGPHTVLVTARYTGDKKAAERFLSAYKPELPQYGGAIEERDTMLLFTVQSPVKALQDDMAEALDESLAWNRYSA